MSRARARIAALVAAVVATAGMTASSTTAVASAATAPGINTHLLWSDVDDADMDRQLDWAAQAGAKTIRVDLGWQSLQEHGPGSYSDWYVEKIDRVVAGANARGIKPVFAFTWTPCWASSAPADVKQDCKGSWWSRGVQLYPPNDADDYGRALAFLADRYKGGKVAAWELWNEPNASEYFKAGDKAAEYAKLVRAAYPAAKAADPATPVLAGSLMESDAEFTEALFSHGIKGNFDGFSFHPYSGELSPLEDLPGSDTMYTFVGGVKLMRDTLARLGAAGTPLWLTEMGYSTNSRRNGPVWSNGVSEETQAEYLRLAFQKVAEWDDVASILWFNMRDTTEDRTDVWGNAGLRRFDGSARPAYEAFRASAAALASGAPVPATGSTPGSGGGTGIGNGNGDGSGDDGSAGTGQGAGSGDDQPAAGSKRKKRLRRLSLRLRRQGGRVVAKGRAPRRGAKLRIRVRRADDTAVAARSRSLTVRAGRKGRYARGLRSLTPGTWRVTVALPGRTSVSRTVVVL